MPRQESSLLLALPDPCLLAVLQYCADSDQRSLFSAARAHSRLRKAAAAVLPSITADLPQQQKANSLKLYLRNHARHVSSINLKGTEEHTVPLRQLPPELQLKSLQLEWFDLQLYPGTPRHVLKPWLLQPSFQGVLGDAARVAALTQLRLADCDLLDGDASAGLAALSVLSTGLQHLSISRIWHKGSFRAQLPAYIVLPRLQQLTYLELAGMELWGPDSDSGVEEGEGAEEGEAAALQPLQALTCLVELRLDDLGFNGARGSSTCRITAELLLSTHLKCLVVLRGVEVEPSALAGKTQLQLLDHDLTHTRFDGAAAEAQLLSCIQPLQELTHLRLGDVWPIEEGSPPVAAYSALTASSKLQHLDVSQCRLPEGAWAHIFPTGRQLRQLRSLNFSYVREPRGNMTIVPEGSRLVSCCPSLQSLDLRGLQGLNAEQLVALQGLSGLHTLRFTGHDLTWQGWLAVCELTRLRELDVQHLGATQQRLLQLTQLRHLTRLVYKGVREDLVLTAQAPEDEPVWRQVPRAVQQLVNLANEPPDP